MIGADHALAWSVTSIRLPSIALLGSFFISDFMNQDYLRPREEDIQWALEVERCALAGRKRFPYSSFERARKKRTAYTGDISALYMECLNGRPMSVRVEAPDQRDGCILTGGVFLHNLFSA
jgi:hypothetical protein